MPIPDRQKQRREYLGKKAGIIGQLTGGTLLLLCLGCLFLGSLVLAIRGYLGTEWSSDTFILAGTAGAFGSGYAFWHMNRFLDKATDRHVEIDISYVPPITPDTIPAEEILVRASQEPTQEQRAVLLRAAESTDTPAEELLRVFVDKME